MALPLPREVREGLETFAIPLRLMSGAGFMVAAICLAPALIMPNKTVAKEFAAVGRTGAIASLLAAVPGIAIGIVLNKDSENILTSLEAATRVEPSISRAADFDGCSPATSGHIVSEMVALFQQPGDSVKKPAACVDCQHYDGHSYGGNPFICAMHPYGWDTEQCPDWEGQRTSFRIVRIQGADRPALYLIKDDPERSLCELVRCGCLIGGGATTELLCKRYRLKSPNGLPGCRFEALSDNPLEALNELIGSCLTE